MNLQVAKVIDKTGAPAARLVLDSPVAFAEIEAKVPVILRAEALWL